MKRLIVGLAAASLLVSGCSSKSKDDKPSATKTTDTTTQSTTPSGAALSPLTGLAYADTRPALVVKIDNYAAKSYPQYGIGSADIVICEGVEGGITRLAAIFHSKDAPRVGPVRSARSSDLHFAVPLNHPLFAYSGTNGNFQQLINDAPVVDISPNKLPAAYHRDGSRPAPYNLFSSTGELRSATPEPRAAAKELVHIDPNATATGTPVTKLEMHWKMPDRPTQTDVTWTWAGDKGNRVQAGKATVDANGPAVSPRNVVVLFVEYPDTGERDRSNSIVPEAKLDGTGEAWVIRDGKLVKGKWKKADNNSPIKLVDESGKDISLLAGQTWIEMPSPGNASVA